MTNKTTFAQFQASRKIEEALVDVFPDDFCDDLEAIGLSYLDGRFYIEKQYDEDAIHAEIHNVHYVVTIGRESNDFGSNLEAAEKFLWNEFAFLEANSDTFERVRFYFADDPTYEGFSDGTTWNGFDNVRVTEKVYDALVSHFSYEYEICGYHGADLDEAMQSFTEIKPDEFGLYDLGNGFATSIDEDHYHVINR